MAHFQKEAPAVSGVGNPSRGARCSRVDVGRGRKLGGRNLAMGNVSDPSQDPRDKGKNHHGAGDLERDCNSHFKSGTCSNRAWMEGIAQHTGLSCSNKGLTSILNINKII